VANAIGLAEDFARGSPCPTLETVVREVEACRALARDDYERDSGMGAAVLAAHAAASAIHSLSLRREPGDSRYSPAAKANPIPHLADVTADLAARDAFLAALQSVGSEGHTEGFIKAAVEDYEKLLTLDLGSYPEEGKPIDSSSNGPLGPLE
jgi:hypothetical protein